MHLTFPVPWISESFIEIKIKLNFYLHTSLGAQKVLWRPLTLLKMGFFGAAHGWWGEGDKKPPSSIKSVTHILKWWNLAVISYLKKVQKIYESCHTPLEFCWNHHFFTGNQQILLYQERLQFDTWFLILLTFLEFLKIVLINMVTILIMSAIMATPSLLRIKVFWNKSYGVVMPVHNAANQILWRDSYYIVDVVMWPKFGNSSSSMGGVIITSIL